MLHSNAGKKVSMCTQRALHLTLNNIAHLQRRIYYALLSSGFAFANVEAAAEFEEQRNRFFAEHERYDDYMEMREGLDLTNISAFKEHVIALTDPDRMPWYASRAVFWICSFCLLSWPLRLVLEYNTAYVHYQVRVL